MVCSVCRSPDRADVDQAIALGIALREIAGRSREGRALGRSALHRHASRCLRMATPGDRLKALTDRAELAEIAADTLARAQELLDRCEQYPDVRATVAAIGAVARALDTAGRLLPDPDAVTHPETVALLTVLAEDLDVTAARKAITSGLYERGADELADALSAVWARRPATLDRTEIREIAS